VAILRGCPCAQSRPCGHGSPPPGSPPARCSVLKGGRVQAVPLSAFSASTIVKAYAQRAGLDPAQLGRRGLISGNN
jgi:hypothetical protein